MVLMLRYTRVFLYIISNIVVLIVPDVVTHYSLPMDLLMGTTLLNPSGLDASAFGSPDMVRGVVGQAIRLDGRNSYVRVTGPGHRQECFGDLDKCPSG